MKKLTATLAVVVGAWLPALAQDAPAPRPTLVRVVGPDGQALAGARVVFYSAPFDETCPLYGAELREFTADQRGLVRADVEPGRVWSAWAAGDRGGTRLASQVLRAVEPGRPIRIETALFPVAKVRIVGLAPWREIYGDSLRLAFQTDIAPHARMAAPLPPGDEPVVALPALPLGNYYPMLEDADAGLLDARYFSPVFIEGDAGAEVLYERDAPLKRVVLGKPTRTRWQVRGVDGQAVAVADVRLRAQYTSLQRERPLTIDGKGEVEIVLPWRPIDARGWFPMQVLVVAPGFLPCLHSLPSLAEDAATTPFVLALQPAPSPRFRLTSPAPAPLFLRVRFFQGLPPQCPSFDALVPVAVGEDQVVRLPGAVPAPRPRSPDFDAQHGRWSLWALLDREPVEIFASALSEVPDRVELDLARLVPVTLTVLHAGGGVVRGGVVHVGHSLLDMSEPSLPHAIGPDGTLSLLRVPGKHAAYVVHPQRGDAVETFEVVAGRPLRREVRLQPFREVRGRVLDPDEKPVAGVTVTLSAASEKINPQLYLEWYGRTFGVPVTDEAGRFTVRVSRLVQRLDLNAYVQQGQTWLYGNTNVEPDKLDGPVIIALRQ